MDIESESRPSPPLLPTTISDDHDSLHSEDAVLTPCSLPVLDHRYYLEFCTFLVGDRLFKVPKFHFVRFTHFDWLKQVDEDTPNNLQDVEKTDFQALLQFVYPIYSDNRPNLLDSEWVSVLKLASKWKMLDVREIAISALPRLPWIQKILLAREYAIFSWLKQGYLHLVEQREPLSVEDAEKLGLETALKLMNIREDSLKRGHGDSRGVSSGYDVVSAVDKELSAELRGVRGDRGADAVDRILWARTQNNLEWLRLAYIGLAERDNGISLEDARTLGLATTVNIYRARERAFTPTSVFSFSLMESCLDYPMIVEDIFAEELKRVYAEGSLYEVEQKRVKTEQISNGIGIAAAAPLDYTHWPRSSTSTRSPKFTGGGAKKKKKKKSC